MKNKKLIISTLFMGTIFFAGCTHKPEYLPENSPKSSIVTMGIDRQDFEKAASDMAKSLLSSGALDKSGGGKSVVMMSDIVNDTTQRFDVKFLTKKLGIAILNSGKAILTSAVGTQRDDLAQDTRKLRNNDEFKKSTTIQKNTLYAPSLSLSGSILQRTAKANRDEQIVEYYFQLSLTDIKTGLVTWEDEVVIGKIGSNDTVTW
ncbi:membrane lipoprotein lipid attachment site [Arcobacter nitrofigilis DSM 7299]|uniref:Penicillin-binding protein activator LpoB n=1 Tax=Arcobacter nitrofigilis (strain ATCC 33309 / DSM 7299 / CCUG 15893 / LMG 7604 / NCTC 12251 / CI) TaxID=572480 RepID=D5V789_ARCNC|nr:penicillin-binding protein activator LpoB [Arcobacter nitrofigilis]ADG94509.1 membrane lipoprotein lipid attachment site [Arcobacter nitrofigilis DSM 7299]